MGIVKTGAHEPREERALTAFAALTREGVHQRTPEELDESLDELMARITTGRSRGRRLVTWSLVGVATAACALVGLRLAFPPGSPALAPAPPMLTYRIEGGTVLPGGYLRESGHAGIELAFNEGSKLC